MTLKSLLVDILIFFISIVFTQKISDSIEQVAVF